MATDVKATHTPGPWTPMIDMGGFRPFVTASAPSGHEHRITVADCPHPADALWSHQRIANARLIAAAPELLEALHRIAYGLEVDGRTADGMTKAAAVALARRAIAKAEVL